MRYIRNSKLRCDKSALRANGHGRAISCLNRDRNCRRLCISERRRIWCHMKRGPRVYYPNTWRRLSNTNRSRRGLMSETLKNGDKLSSLT
uniref:Uncharacterized protein n=1 Tax=Arundo donax TaxID=35708 RepID=A0A0A9HLL2_ARUDO